jgi:predicted nucleotidyltransferase
MPTEQELRTAERIRDRILEAAGDAVERIVFYGSRVTGRARPTSDYDILVVLRDPVPDWAEASLQLSDLFSTFERAVDVQVFGETEYEESRPVAGTVAFPAHHHGLLLYAKPGGSSRSTGTTVDRVGAR